MDADEVLRLKQISGLTEMFAGRQFSQAWTIVTTAGTNAPPQPAESPAVWRSTSGSACAERIGAEDGERDRRHADLSGQPAAEADIVKIGDGAVVRQRK